MTGINIMRSETGPAPAISS